MSINKTPWLVFLLALLSGGASARDNGWEIGAAGYIWFPESKSRIATPFGDATSTLSASDALDALDVGVMGAFSARKGDWALFGDLFHLDLTLDESSPFGVAFSGAESRTRLTALAGYGLYTIHNGSMARLELGGGLRLMSSDIELTLRGNRRPDFRSGTDDNWVDPLLAFRATAALSEKATAVLWLDAGGFDIGAASEETWQLAAMFNWQISHAWKIGAGFRALYVERESDGIPYSLRMSGPILGAEYRF